MKIIGIEYRPIRAEDLKSFKISFSIPDKEKTSEEIDIDLFENKFTLKEIKSTIKK